MSGAIKQKRISQMTKQSVKPMYAAIAKFSGAEDIQLDAVKEFLAAGGRSEWIEGSEKALLRNKESDSSNPLKWADFSAAIYKSRGDDVHRIAMSEPSALNDEEKALRTKYKGEIGAYANRFAGKVRTAEKKRDAEATGEKITRTKKTTVVFADEQNEKILKRFQSDETPPCSPTAVRDWIAAAPWNNAG